METQTVARAVGEMYVRPAEFSPGNWYYWPMVHRAEGERALGSAQHTEAEALAIIEAERAKRAPKIKRAGSMTVRELGTGDVMRSEIDSESGSLLCWREFEVQRPGHEAHRVSVEIMEDGANNDERCDCTGYRMRHACAHIDAVLAFMDAQGDAENEAEG